MTLTVFVALMPAHAVEPQPFDYWLLALSWSPEYCATEARPEDPQCSTRRYGYIVHGLWPQHERGYPGNCPRPARLPQSWINRMLPLMPSPRLIQHEWNKHGACTGWPINRYFETLERAHQGTKIPPAHQNLGRYLSTTRPEIEKLWIGQNPGHRPDSIAVQCSGQYLREVRLCLDKDLRPRSCGPDVRDRCGKQVVLRPQK